MLKQFNLEKLIFDEPQIIRDEDGNETRTTSGENWYPVHSQAQIDEIWQTVSGGGEVWVENGVIQCSGAAPSAAHKWQGGKWKVCKQAQAEILSQNQTALLRQVEQKAAALKAKHLAGYSAREEQEARGQAPLMLLNELFAAGGYLVGGKAWFNQELNSAANLKDAKLLISYDYCAVPPLEQLGFNQYISDEYLVEFSSKLAGAASA